MAYESPSPEYGGAKWNRRRWAIFKAVGYRCAMCGRYAKGDLVLHHKIPIKISHNNSSSNLQVLCKQCHYMIHKKYIDNKDVYDV